MIVYLAGNTPDRVRQEKQITNRGLNRFRLLSFFFYKTDITMRHVFDFWLSLLEEE